MSFPVFPFYIKFKMLQGKNGIQKLIEGKYITTQVCLMQSEWWSLQVQFTVEMMNAVRHWNPNILVS